MSVCCRNPCVQDRRAITTRSRLIARPRHTGRSRRTHATHAATHRTRFQRTICSTTTRKGRLMPRSPSVWPARRVLCQSAHKRARDKASAAARVAGRRARHLSPGPDAARSPCRLPRPPGRHYTADIPGIAIGLQNAAKAAQMRTRVLAFAVGRVAVERGWRIGAAEWLVVADIGPQSRSAGAAQARSEHRHLDVVGMHAVASHHVAGRRIHERSD